jgi:hypothetical protein
MTKIDEGRKCYFVTYPNAPKALWDKAKELQMYGISTTFSEIFCIMVCLPQIRFFKDFLLKVLYIYCQFAMKDIPRISDARYV